MLEKDSFSERCYKLLCQVPPGKVTTYGEIARVLGSKAYRAVGQAMRVNPNAPRVPCHRVVRSNGQLGGYALGVKRKIELLTREGVLIRSEKVENLSTTLYRFKARKNLTKKRARSR